MRWRWPHRVLVGVGETKGSPNRGTKSRRRTTEQNSVPDQAADSSSDTRSSPKPGVKIACIIPGSKEGDQTGCAEICPWLGLSKVIDQSPRRPGCSNCASRNRSIIRYSVYYNQYLPIDATLFPAKPRIRFAHRA